MITDDEEIFFFCCLCVLIVDLAALGGAVLHLLGFLTHMRIH